MIADQCSGMPQIGGTVSVGLFSDRSGSSGGRTGWKWVDEVRDILHLIVLPFLILWWIGKILYWIVVWSYRLFSRR